MNAKKRDQAKGRGRGGGGGGGAGSGNASSGPQLNRIQQNYRRGGGGGGSAYGQRQTNYSAEDAESAEAAERLSKSEMALARQEVDDALDEKFGFARKKDNETRVGWLVNFHPAAVPLDRTRVAQSAVDFYFIEEDGSKFKATLVYQPYFYIAVKEGTAEEVDQYLRRKFEGLLAGVEHCMKEDLDLKNHLVGLKQLYLKLSFVSVADLLKVRKPIMQAVKKNSERKQTEDTYSDTLFASTQSVNGNTKTKAAASVDCYDYILDIREFDVPYHIRVAIDNNLFVGHWYTVRCNSTETSIVKKPEMVERPEVTILTFDIETTKLPLKFPDSKIDCIMMISYMIGTEGFLITNREVISADVPSFEYSPKPAYKGEFTVFNEVDEPALLRRFFDHIIETKPTIFVTFNGDFFDWPFVEARANIHGMSMFKEIGFSKDMQDEYKSRHGIHMDAFRWVKRDSYLPQGSQGLKAVTKAKLRYNPVEVDPEDMCRMAAEQPQEMASYSVSDAVATYYLYFEYVHPFIFSLCTIIPMEPDEVLRKGSGTLCETLLMVEAFRGGIIMPNKQETDLNKMYKGHLLDMETYVGGHVEALESGVFRSDLKYQFRLVPEAFQMLIDRLDETIRHEIRHEANVDPDCVTNMEEIQQSIVSSLERLRDTPLRVEEPLIYHLDVGAMYPNIILTNRLQPSSLITEETCAACDFNRPGSNCQRKLTWSWRGEYLPAKRNEYEMIKLQLESERINEPDGNSKAFHELSADEQSVLLKKRLGDYCRKVYKKARETKVEERESTVCMRENSFYVDTVRDFRDRRYEFKALHKKWKKEVDTADTEVKRAKARGMVILYDSLQLAHKCILNSFYGYVMRKGARWYSMEMAGIVCHTGANIIKQARELVEQIGRPLELDTDGIWCMLPGSFPENFEVKTTDPKKPKFVFSYPGAMLNVMVYKEFTNHQYQELDPADPQKLTFITKSENSIFFEVDGPYRAMILPASKEEDKRLKKRYAVFNEDGSLAELKGFEIKRRGELKIVKSFQSEVFETFLEGGTLEECYQKVSAVANYWLDILYSKAADLGDEELFDLISENRSMSRTLEDYGEQKSTSISTAKRLAEFLGDQMVKDKGLACQFIISKKPEGLPVTDRAVPTAIFRAEPSVRKHYLRQWLKSPGQSEFNIRTVLDWDYYIERLGSCIQKIVTIPAAMQKIRNFVPRVVHPDWLNKRLAEKSDVMKQKKMHQFMTGTRNPVLPSRPARAMEVNDVENAAADDDDDDDAERERVIGDIEDVGGVPVKKPNVPVVHVARKRGVGDDSDVQEPVKSWREMGEAPEDYQEWLVFQKEKWRLQRAERKKRRTEFGAEQQQQQQQNRALGQGPRAKLGAGAGGLSAFFQRQTRSLVRYPWELIQIAETRRPGEFRAWLLCDRQLHCVDLMIPREFYVNSRTADPKSAWPRVNRILPRSYPCLNLYKFSMPEAQYLENSRQLQAFFTHVDIEGVYETRIPLLFRALLQMGCVCAVQKTSRRWSNPSDTDPFQLDDLELKPVSQFPYLTPGSFRTVYIYHSRSDTRGMIGFFNGAKITIINIDPFKTNAIPNANRVYSQARRESLRVHFPGDEAAAALLAETVNIEVKSVLDNKRAFKLLQQLLAECQEQRRGPTVMLVQSPVAYLDLIDQVPTLNDFPVVQVPVDRTDNAYEALNWQSVAIRRMMAKYCYSPKWLAIRLEQARYSQVPIGNVSADYGTFASDIAFGRALLKQGHVLWISPTSLPDLGGKEEDDHRLMSDTEGSQGAEINVSGDYITVCVDIGISSLAVNTVLQSGHVNDLEGAAGTAGTFDSVAPKNMSDHVGLTNAANLMSAFDEAALCAPAFRVLKSVVHGWLHEVSSQRNEIADSLLMQFYRWLKTSGALLYDPGLCRMLHAMMKKLFMQLLAEFRRLGATIVYANFNRIVVATKKQQFDDAKAYVDFILDSIRQRDLFSIIFLEPKMFWMELLWLDTANFGAVDVESSDGDVSEVQVIEASPASRHYHRSPKKLTPALITPSKNVISPLQKQHKEKRPRLRRLRRVLDRDDAENADKSDLDDDDEDEEDEDDDEENVGGGNVSGEDDNDFDDENVARNYDEPLSGASNVLAQAEREARESTPSRGHDQPKLILSWNLKEYLPTLLHGFFDALIGKFMDSIHRHRMSKLDSNGLSQPHHRQQQQQLRVRKRVVTDNDDEDGDAAELNEGDMEGTQLESIEVQNAKFYHDLIQKEIFALLSRWLSDLIVALHESEAEFPNLPGSHLPLSNPLLEFIKSICHVLSLNPDVQSEVQTMKRSLLRLVNVREFSPEAQFVNPCSTFVLADVICNKCNYCRDLDLCRDVDLLDPSGIWRCPDPLCAAEYDKDEIEQTLIEIITRRTISYQLQDCVCKKCHEVRADNLSRFCKCSGSYVVNTYSSSSVLERLKTFLSIAKYHSFSLLEDTCQWMLARSVSQNV